METINAYTKLWVKKTMPTHDEIRAALKDPDVTITTDGLGNIDIDKVLTPDDKVAVETLLTSKGF